MEMLYKG